MTNIAPEKDHVLLTVFLDSRYTKNVDVRMPCDLFTKPTFNRPEIRKVLDEKFGTTGWYSYDVK